jgi:cytochrome c-type biogenesis protein CcmE
MRRTQKLLVTSLVVGAAVGLILWNTAAETAAPALGVSEAKRKAADYETGAVAVLLNGSIVESFVIADSLEQLRVEYNQPPPDNFGPKDVIVYGMLRTTSEGTILLQATSIQVGCSSKY